MKEGVKTKFSPQTVFGIDPPVKRKELSKVENSKLLYSLLVVLHGRGTSWLVVLQGKGTSLLVVVGGREQDCW